MNEDEDDIDARLYDSWFGPSTSAATSPRKVILLVDDTMDIELKKHKILPEYSYISSHFSNHNVDIIHVKNKRDAVDTLRSLKTEFLKKSHFCVAPENLTVISDYKLQNPGEQEEWGPDILTALAEDKEYHPANFFLMSKSGFRDQDKPKLDKIGARYFHTNEFFFAAADAAHNEALKEVFSQRATTHVFREWFNKEFGTHMALDQYRSPHVAEVEKGRIPVQEVIRRIAQDKITHAEAMQLLDEPSVRAAFRSTVDLTGAAALPAKKIAHGIEGPSVCGRVAYSEADMDRIHAETPDAPIILVLDHDYSPKDHGALSRAQGVVMLAQGTQHIQVWAKDARMPVLFANKEKYPDFSVNDGVLQLHNGLTETARFAGVGDWMTLDGTTLTAHAGKLPIRQPAPETLEAVQEMARIGDYNNRLTWHFKKDDDTLTDHTGVGVMVNASTAEQVSLAKNTPGVQGVGLLRTERMFNTEERRLLLLRALLCEGREKEQALEELKQAHMNDLEPIFAQQSEDFPINVRLFDFPPAEFFPNPDDEQAIASLAKNIGVDAEKVRTLTRHAYDSNLRGAGFALEYPEIAEAQCNAIFAAASAYPHVTPRLLIPAVRSPEQIKPLRAMMKEAADYFGSDFKLGSMIETRELAPFYHDDAEALALKKVVAKSDFICLGTNDLTEELLNLKRGDVASHIRWSHRSRSAIKPFDEFAPDVKTVLENITRYARQVNPDIPITLCGDQATSRSSAMFAQERTLHALSVPATPEAMTQALVETGRASLLEAIKHREIVNADIAARSEAERALKAGDMPSDVDIVSEKILNQSPIAFIVIEDDGMQRNDFYFNLNKYPLLLCENISDGLKAAAAMRAQGKEVHIYTDANVGLMSYNDSTQGTGHPDSYKLRSNNRMAAGVCFTHAVDRGEIEGLKTTNISLMSAANFEVLPAGVKEFSKSSIIGSLKQDMNERMNAAQARAAEKPLTGSVVAGTGNAVEKIDVGKDAPDQTPGRL